MLKFKDLYVSLASEEPVQGPVSGIFCGWGGWQVLPVWTPPIATAQRVQNLPTSFSGPQCWTEPVLSEDDLRSLKENLKTSLQKAAARETKTIDDVAELD